MIKTLAILLLLATTVVYAEDKKTDTPPAPQATKPEPPKEAYFPLTPQEQLKIRLAATENQLKTLKKQYKDAKKANKDSSKLTSTIEKIRKAHGWDDSIQLQDKGQQIVGVKQLN